MPRAARVIGRTGIYHVITRAFPDRELFYDDGDKKEMLEILKKLKVEENFKIYAYCLMDTHTHFLIDTNGAKLSVIMQKFNLRYGNYLRKTGKHKGPLFRGRYNSKPVDDDRYLIQVSKYIHRNPIDIRGYKNRLEEYEFSSLGLYLGSRRDTLKICDENFIMKYFGKNRKKARKSYCRTMLLITDEKFREIEKSFDKEDKTEYRDEKTVLVRECDEEKLRDFVCKKTGISKREIYLKNRRESIEARALYVVFLTQFSAKSQKEICKIIGNITQSNVCQLCRKGVQLILGKYKKIFNELISLFTRKLIKS